MHTHKHMHTQVDRYWPDVQDMSVEEAESFTSCFYRIHTETALLSPPAGIRLQ